MGIDNGDKVPGHDANVGEVAVFAVIIDPVDKLGPDPGFGGGIVCLRVQNGIVLDRKSVV